MNARLLFLTLCLSLCGCEKFTEITNQAKFNGRAIGAACRQSGRSLEDCFQRNPRVARADIFSGWKEMNEYMMAKKLEIIPPPPDKPKSEPEPNVEINAGEDASSAKDDKHAKDDKAESGGKQDKGDHKK
ncbi:hypothetical protein KSF73_11750 [Burkholderiaceae bacterium DAT-1]|nr:hypothetical protein [Burkholderiaceae bacterium DAT-1]